MTGDVARLQRLAHRGEPNYSFHKAPQHNNQTQIFGFQTFIFFNKKIKVSMEETFCKTNKPSRLHFVKKPIFYLKTVSMDIFF